MEGKTVHVEIKNAIKRFHWPRLIFWCFVVSLILLDVGLEWTFDLRNESFWLPVVYVLNLFLVVGYIFYTVSSGLIQRKEPLLWFWHHKLDIVLSVFSLLFISTPRLAGSLVTFRLLGIGLSRFLIFDFSFLRGLRMRLQPPQALALSFIGIILAGSVLLLFPAATMDGKGAHFSDALFMMTSAATVTGLSVVDIGTYFSFFGQAVILCVIQAGGIGIMVLSAAFSMLVGGRLPRRRQVNLGEIMATSAFGSLKTLLVAVATTTFVMELCGAVLLFFLWGESIGSLQTRAWWAIFHSVSAFCNCGFALTSDSFARWVGDPLVCGVVEILIIVGGLGFFVVADLTDQRVWRVWRPAAIWERLQIQTKVVLLSALLLNMGGMLIFLFLEYDGLLRHFSIPTKINASFFQTVVLRTAGFTAVSIEYMAMPTLLFCLVWMFIGGAPGSTAGGIKTTTAAVAIMAVRAMIRGRNEVEMWGRHISNRTVSRSLSICFISAAVITLFFMSLLMTQDLSFPHLLFETVAAFGTTGLSMGVTSALNEEGRFLIILLMYIGRIGPLTMALAIGQRVVEKEFRLPEGHLAVG